MTQPRQAKSQELLPYQQASVQHLENCGHISCDRVAKQVADDYQANERFMPTTNETIARLR